MTVKELIQKLQELPEEAKDYPVVDDWDASEFYEVSVYEGKISGRKVYLGSR